MKRKLFLLSFLIAAVLTVLLVANSVERRTLIGQSSTSSPDGNWKLHLQLVEYSTLLNKRKVLDADLVHASRRDWDVKTSIPLPNANAETISNQNPDHPVTWSDDSSNVSYWINDQQKDTIRIEANEERHVFQRDLNALRVISSNKTAGEHSMD